jgi:hypothetical protein
LTKKPKFENETKVAGRRKFLRVGAVAGAAAVFAPALSASRIEVRDNARPELGDEAGADSGLGRNPFAPGGRDEVKAFEFDEVTIAERAGNPQRD